MRAPPSSPRLKQLSSTQELTALCYQSHPTQNSRKRSYQVLEILQLLPIVLKGSASQTPHAQSSHLS